MIGAANSQLPQGTVTFVFTDIERSTESVAALGDERYAELQKAHRGLLRDAFARHNGVEVGTEGDAFFVAFQRAGDAAAAAIDAQRAMEAHEWPGEARLRTRIGLHTGEALVADGDYVGHDVHKAKRISDAGHGGQILLSQTTRDLIAGHLAEGVTIKDLGPHRLKDLGEPQHVFQLAALGLPADFPRLRTLDVAEHNLPVQLTTFVGRNRELEDVSRMLASNRLVTLTGVGGSGKTRLAIHAAAAELERSPDGVFFCDLSRLSDEEALAPAVARSLALDSVREEFAALPPPDAIRRYLGSKRTLLVLDNCEHLIDSVAALAESLLTSCANLRILATSREPLEVDGEHSWSVPSLDSADEAMSLFAERAAAVRGGFSLTEENAADVKAICERLDGMPLAIELAAAQVGHLSPRQIAERLDDRFMILTGGRRRVQRQQTLQAAMDWSWDLLDERDQTLLRRLSVFQGGCTLEAAEAICGDGIDVVGGLRSLVAKSLVLADEVVGAVRYRLLETVRMYAEEKLAASGESEVLRRRHRDHYLAWAEATPIEASFAPGIVEHDLETEAENIRAGLRWCEAQGEFDLSARLLIATRRLWVYLHREAPARFQPTLDAELPPEFRGPLLAAFVSAAGAPLEHAGLQDEAIELMEQADLPSPWLSVMLQAKAGRVTVQALIAGDQQLAETAIALADQAIEAGRSVGDYWEGWGHHGRGSVLLMQLRHEEALPSYLEVCRKIRPDGPFFVPALALEGLVVLKQLIPNSWTPDDDALADAAKQKHIAHEDRPRGIWFILELLTTEGIPEARAHLAGAIEYVRERAPEFFFTVPLTLAGTIEALDGQWERAGRLLAAAIKPGIIGSAPAYALHRHWTPIVRDQVGPERGRQLRDEGRAMSLDEALAYALEGIRVAQT